MFLRGVEIEQWRKMVKLLSDATEFLTYTLTFLMSRNLTLSTCNSLTICYMNLIQGDEFKSTLKQGGTNVRLTLTSVIVGLHMCYFKVAGNSFRFSRANLITFLNIFKREQKVFYNDGKVYQGDIRAVSICPLCLWVFTSYLLAKYVLNEFSL